MPLERPSSQSANQKKKMFDSVSSTNTYSKDIENTPSVDTFVSVMQRFALAEVRYQGVYFEVHVECSNPEVPKIDPIVYKSDRNLPRAYFGKGDWGSRFLHRYDQFMRCVNTTERLHQEAIEAQQILQEQFKSKKFKVSIVQRKRN